MPDEYDDGPEVPITMIFESDAGWSVVTFFGQVVPEGHA